MDSGDRRNSGGYSNSYNSNRDHNSYNNRDYNSNREGNAYNNSYNNRYNSSSSNQNSSHRSQRPDGSYRPATRPPRPGYSAPGESPAYVPPARRYDAPSTTPSTIETAAEEREVSWADEDAPIVKEVSGCEGLSETEAESESEAVVEVEKVKEVELVETATVNETTTVNEAQVKRAPSKLATAIDDALDSLSLGAASNESGSAAAERPTMGRFAAQIARNERNGYTLGSGYQRRDYTQRDQRDGYQRSDGYQRNYQQQRYSQDTECPKLKVCFESLSKLRREMAIINAKLEYIRYMMAAKDTDEMTQMERERVGQEANLMARINAIYEEIEALY